MAAVANLVGGCASSKRAAKAPDESGVTATTAEGVGDGGSGGPAGTASPAYDVKTETVPSRPVIQVHAELAPDELSDRFGQVFSEVYPYVLQSGGATPAGAPFGCYHELTAERVVVDIGLPISKPLAAKGEMQPGELPAGEIVFTVHEGAYQHLPQAHAAIQQWLEQQGRQAQDVACDFYEVGPGQASNEKDYRTQVVYWLKD